MMELILIGINFILTGVIVWFLWKERGEIRHFISQLYSLQYRGERDASCLPEAMGTRFTLNDNTVNILKNLPRKNIVEIAAAVAQDDILNAQRTEERHDSARVPGSDKRDEDPPVESLGAERQEDAESMAEGQRKWD